MSINTLHKGDDYDNNNNNNNNNNNFSLWMSEQKTKTSPHQTCHFYSSSMTEVHQR
jgi:hypothetical protein